MTINERFQTIIDVCFNGNKRAFATASGISPTVVENVVGSRKGNPSYEVLVKVCSNANISEAWLLTGTGSMLKTSSSSSCIAPDIVKTDPTTGLNYTAPTDPTMDNPDGRTNKFKDNYDSSSFHQISRNYGEDPYKPFERLINPTSEPKGIPLVSVQAVGGFAGKDFSIHERDIEAYYVIPKFRNLNVDFLIEVVGDSMMPRIFPGDIVACSIIRNPQFIQWNKTYLISSEEQGMIVKRLKKSNDKDCYLAVSDNLEYDPFDIPKNDIRGIARVVGVIHAE